MCDDIEVGVEENRFTRIENACIKGAALFYAGDDPQRRAVCRIAGAEVASEAAIESAARLLLKAKKPLIFGMDNSTLEAQATGIKLAKVLGAVIDDTSSFCQGALIRSLFSDDIPTCSFSEAKESLESENEG